ncbi:MAG: tetratricopeptide repeat protein [Pseudomonadales bacterium]
MRSLLYLAKMALGLSVLSALPVYAQLSCESAFKDASTQAYTLCSQTAEQGIAADQYRLAQLHIEGRGVERDVELAHYWLLKASRADYPQAQFELAKFYLAGDDAAKNIAQAMNWLTLASDQNIAAASFTLGELYERGELVTGNASLAKIWYTLAKEQGDERAAQRLAALAQ